MKTPIFEEITARIARWPFPAGVDGVVGIASGGVVPAVMVAQRLGVGLKMIELHYRDAMNEPQFAEPRLISVVPGLGPWRRVLLVDDAHLSGKSWNAARAMLPRKVEVLPFVFTGKVDFALFPVLDYCSEWPWQTC